MELDRSYVNDLSATLEDAARAISYFDADIKKRLAVEDAPEPIEGIPAHVPETLTVDRDAVLRRTAWLWHLQERMCVLFGDDSKLENDLSGAGVLDDVFGEFDEDTRQALRDAINPLVQKYNFEWVDALARDRHNAMWERNA